MGNYASRPTSDPDVVNVAAVCARVGSLCASCAWRAANERSLLHAAAANTSDPSRSTLGHVSNYASLHLVQPPGDNSIIRVQYGNLFWRGRVPYGMMLLSGTVKGTVVDIGANIGAVAIAIAKRHPTLRVIACEPAPVTFFYLLWK